jgi:type I restriction enzyme, S subunit
MTLQVNEPSAKYLVRQSPRSVAVEELPRDWTLLRLIDVAEVRGGVAKNANVAISDPIEVAYLRVANVQDGYLDLGDVSKIKISKADLKRYSLLPGDVLMNEGGDLDKLGRGALWRGEIETCVHQNHVFSVRCKQQLLGDYLNVWTGSAIARRFFLLAGKQTTNLASISKSSLGEMPVFLPRVEEQHAIATALSDVDALIAGLEKMIAKKRDLKQAAMQQLLTGQTRLPGFGGAWSVKRLGDLAEMGSGGTPPSANAAYYGGEIPWVAIADMTGGGKYIASTERNLSVLGLANSAAQMFPAGTVLYAMYASLGECSIATVPVTTSQAILGIRPKADLHSEFLYYVLTSWKSMVKGLGQQGTQANLNKGIVADFKISLPSFEEQESIAAVLVEMDTELVALETRLSKTRDLKQGMMQELLTGRTRLV